MLEQWMGMALRSGPTCLAICCSRRGRRRCRRDRDRASAGNRRAAILRTARLLCPAGLLRTAGLLCTTGLLLRAAGTTGSEPLTPIEAGASLSAAASTVQLRKFSRIVAPV